MRRRACTFAVFSVMMAGACLPTERDPWEGDVVLQMKPGTPPQPQGSGTAADSVSSLSPAITTAAVGSGGRTAAELRSLEVSEGWY